MTHDQLATGGKVRILTVIDTFSRYAHAIDAGFQYRAENVGPEERFQHDATLEWIRKEVGYPKTIRVDQGSDFVLRDLDHGSTPTTSFSTSQGVDAEHRFTITQTNRQCVDRGVQRTTAGGVPEHALVHELARRKGKASAVA